MNWEAVGAIGEIVGAMGVIATLAFLAFQVRQNTRLLETQSSQLQQNQDLAAAEALGDAGNSVQASMIAIAQSEELSKIFFAGLRDYEGMAPELRMRFALVMGPLIAGAAAQADRKFQLGIDTGAMDPSDVKFVLDVVDTPGGRSWWIRYKNRYPARFIVAVDEALQRNSDDAQHGVRCNASF